MLPNLQLSSQARAAARSKFANCASNCSQTQSGRLRAVAQAIERLQSAVLQALADGNQRILVSMLEAGEWAVEGNEVVIKVSESQTVVDMSLGADARRLAIASASGILGRAVKLRIVPGATVATARRKKQRQRCASRTGRTRQLAAGAAPSRMQWSAGCRRNSAPRFER